MEHTGSSDRRGTTHQRGKGGRRPALGSRGVRSGACIAVVLILLMFLPRPLAAQSPGGDVAIDYGSARREIQSFEKVVNKLLGVAFSDSPFALVQKTKGAYLPGYGVTFTFLVNIHRAMISTPFGEIPRKNYDTPEQKKRRIEDLKEKLVRALQDNGDSFQQLRPEEWVSVVAFFEDREFPDEENQNKTIVLSVRKRDLKELAGREEQSREFKQRMRILEY